MDCPLITPVSAFFPCCLVMHVPALLECVCLLDWAVVQVPSQDSLTHCFSRQHPPRSMCVGVEPRPQWGLHLSTCTPPTCTTACHSPPTWSTMMVRCMRLLPRRRPQATSQMKWVHGKPGKLTPTWLMSANCRSVGNIGFQEKNLSLNRDSNLGPPDL